MKFSTRPRRFAGSRQALAVTLIGCSPVSGDPATCVPGQPVDLPAQVREASGVAASKRHPGVLWTHNDSGNDAVLFAIDLSGRLIGETRIAGTENVDWEDIAVGACPSGSCVYIADTGDNDEDRDDAAVYRIPEPDAAGGTSAEAERFAIRFPDGPRDVESIFVTPAGVVYLIGKGRHSAPAVYRFTPANSANAIVVEQVQLLGSAPFLLPSDLITSADALADGTVAVRSYATLRFYTLTEAGLVPGKRDPVGLTQFDEAQGEGVTFVDPSTIVLTSEGRRNVNGTMRVLQCTE